MPQRMEVLTRRQREIFNFLRDNADRFAYPPSLDELCAALGMASRGSLYKHIMALIKAGLVEPFRGNKQGGVRLTVSSPFNAQMTIFPGWTYLRPEYRWDECQHPAWTPLEHGQRTWQRVFVPGVRLNPDFSRRNHRQAMGSRPQLCHWIRAAVINQAVASAIKQYKKLWS